MNFDIEKRQERSADYHPDRNYYTQQLCNEGDDRKISIILRLSKFFKKTGNVVQRAYCPNKAKKHYMLKSHPSSAEFSIDKFSLHSNEKGNFKSKNGLDTDLQNTKTLFRCPLLTSFLLHIFPFIKIIRDYNLKRCLPNDIIAGFTVGIMNIPQGMAYAMLATLPPVCGLYCALISPLVYFIFGTSRHLAVGVYSIVSLLVGASLDRSFSTIFPSQDSLTTITSSADSNETDFQDEITSKRVLIATSICMVVGLIQLLMGFCRMGFITRFLSDPMISGFTVGSAIHTVTSQLSTMLGLKIPKHNGLFNVPRTLYSICKNLPKTNLVALGMSSISVVVLYVFKRWINPRISRKIKVPIPAELLIIIFGAITTKFMDLSNQHNLKVVGHVPSGLPIPSVPDISLVATLIPEVIVISLVSFSISFSLSSVYAKQEGYSVDSNQELVAYGITNLTGSFFSMFPVAGSISRTAVQVNMQGKSQIAGLFTSLVVLFVVLFAGPLFCSVPMCCLSAIILIALQSMFLQILTLPRLWRFSVWDFLSWIVTFSATAVLDVIYGIIIGILFSAFSVILRAQISKAYVLGKFGDTEVFQPTAYYSHCKESNGVKIVRYDGSLFYACSDNFYSAIVEATMLDPRLIKNKKNRVIQALALINSRLGLGKHGDMESFIELEIQSRPSPEIPTRSDESSSEVIDKIEHDRRRLSRQIFAIPNLSITENIRKVHLSWLARKSVPHERYNATSCGCSLNCSPCNQLDQNDCEQLVCRRNQKLSRLDDLLNAIPFKYLVLDCSACNFIDIVGIKSLQLLISDYNDIGVTVCLASASNNLRASMEVKEFSKMLDPSLLFISVHDALLWIQSVENTTPSLEQSVRSIGHSLKIHPVPSGITMDTMLEEHSDF